MKTSSTRMLSWKDNIVFFQRLGEFNLPGVLPKSPSETKSLSRKILKAPLLAILLISVFSNVRAQKLPELIYYKFDSAGKSTVWNYASSPVGTNPASIVGGSFGSSLYQSAGNGEFKGGLRGYGTNSYVNTGWNINLGTGSWTISLYLDSVPSSGNTNYYFGDATSTFRCFTNGVAGANNLILRGPLTDVLIDSGALNNAKSVCHFVYDAAAGKIYGYRNGKLKTTVAQGALNISGSVFKVGEYSSSIGLNGVMDEFRLYNRALSATEIANTWNKELGPPDAGIVSIDSISSSYCGGVTKNIYVRAKNFSLTQLDSFYLGWSVNGIVQTAKKFTSAMKFGDTSALISLGSYPFSVAGTYTVKVWTYKPNGSADSKTSNDTMTNTVVIKSVPFGSLTNKQVCSGSSATLKVVSSSLSLDGTDDYVSVPGTYGGASWKEATVEAWVKSTGTTGDFQAIVSSATYAFVHFQLKAAGNIVVYTNAGQVNLPIVPETPSNVWRHIAFVIKSGASKVYVNGVLFGSVSDTFSYILPSNGIRIGSGFSNSRFFKGNIDEVRIWNKARTQAEIQANMSRQIAPSTSGLVSYYRFNEESGSSAIDAAGSNNGTLQSGATRSSDIPFGDINKWTYRWTPSTGLSATTGASVTASPTTSTTYYVTISDSNGCSNNDSVLVTVNPKPSVSFTASNACANSSISFTNNTTVSSGTISSYQWKFGDGNTSTSANPTKSYSTAGTYTVWLIATTSNGCMDSISKSITVYPRTSVDFSASNACANGSISFTNNSKVSSDSISSYLWKFGDGSTSTNENPSKFYTVAGTYIVTLIATTSHGCADSLQKSITIHPNPQPKFVAANVCNGQAMQFADSTADTTVISRRWDFGDSSSSTLVSPSHKYAAPGTYTVKLTLQTNKGCTSSATRSVTVYSLPDTGFIVKKLTYRNYSFAALDTIQAGYEWDFGDSSFSNKAVTSHFYKADGTFNVKLKVTNTQGCVSVATKQVIVNTVGISDPESENTSVKLYPNPFDDCFTLSYTLNKFSKVRISIMDLTGREVALVAQGEQTTGEYNYSINADNYDMAGGIYFVMINLDGHLINKQIVRLK